MPHIFSEMATNFRLNLANDLQQKKTRIVDKINKYKALADGGDEQAQKKLQQYEKQRGDVSMIEQNLRKNVQMNPDQIKEAIAHNADVS